MALIGVGGIGGYHLESIRQLEQRDATRLVAVAEPMVERFAELKRDLEARGIRWYVDYRDLLREEADLHAVTIATPIPLHFEMTLACLERGLYVNLEKPPAPLIQQLETMIAADPAGRVTVGFQMIVSSCVQRMKQLIVDGAIGEVQSIRAVGCWPRRESYYQRAKWAGTMTLNGKPVFDGPATNALAHVVHNIMFLAGKTQAEFAVPTQVTGELYRARPIESYDVACLGGVFASGAEFTFAATHSIKDAVPFKIEVKGTAGWLLLSEDGEYLQTSAGENLRCPETTQQLLDVCYERLLGVMRNGETTYTSLRDTLGYVRATNGLYLSSGGIHNIAPDWVDRFMEGDEIGFRVRGLRAAVERVFAEGKLFSQLDLPWAAARPTPVRLDSFQTLSLDETA